MTGTVSFFLFCRRAGPAADFFIIAQGIPRGKYRKRKRFSSRDLFIGPENGKTRTDGRKVIDSFSESAYNKQDLSIDDG